MKSLTRIAILSALTLAATSPLTLAQTQRGTATGTAQGTERGERKVQDKAQAKRELAEKMKRKQAEGKQLTDGERKRQLEAKRKKMEAQKGEATRGNAKRAADAQKSRQTAGEQAKPALTRRGENGKQRPEAGKNERAGEMRDKEKAEKKKGANPAAGQLATAIRQNRIRMARMDRLRKVFRERGDNEKVLRVQGLRAKESANFQKKLDRFKNALGAEQYDRIMKRLSK